MIIAVAGLGYVGAVTAGCLPRLGWQVIGVDTDEVKAGAVAAGQSPVAEPGLDELLGEALAAGRLQVDRLPAAVERADVVMVAVGTPSLPTGGLDLTAVQRVCSEIGRALPDDGRFRTVIIRSTVLPGTTNQLLRPLLEESSGRRSGIDFGMATNPEFLREGSGVKDFFEAARTVIGADDERSAAVASRVYEGLDAPLQLLPIATSELVKYTDNAFHATKIAFANEIGSFARRFGVDGRQVMELLATDRRLNISPAYLRPGFAFGGSCLPKDLRALTDRARTAELELPLISSVLASNEAHFARGLELIEAAGGRRLALVGLTFKSGTDDLRESPAVALAEELLERGYELAIYDADVRPDRLRGANRAFIEQRLPHLAELLRDSLAGALDGAQTVVLAKSWPGVEAELGPVLRADQALVDLAGAWPPGNPPERYFGIAW